MFKKLILKILLVSLIFTAYAEGKVLNVYSYTKDFEAIFDVALKDTGVLPRDYRVNYVVLPYVGSEYQSKMEALLKKQNEISDDEKIDVFLVEPDCIRQFIDGPYLLDLKKDLKLRNRELENQYDYALDLGTSDKGVLKALSWQICPGVFIYNRSLALDLLENDSPEYMSRLLSDWKKFETIAARARSKGIKMTGSFDSTFRAFENNRTTKWVEGRKLQIDPVLEQWVTQTKYFYSYGMCGSEKAWSQEFYEEMKSGKVLGYFGPKWYYDYIIFPNDYYNDWAICTGPAGFQWGSYYLCVPKGTDNKELVKDFLYELCCNPKTMALLKEQYGVTPNNKKIMQSSMSKKDYIARLGGQNECPVLDAAALRFRQQYTTSYDTALNELFVNTMKGYFLGVLTLDEAWLIFFKRVSERFPELSVPKLY